MAVKNIIHLSNLYLLQGDWVAPNATVIGDVRLGEGASLWHGVIVRGDTAQVTIGKNSTI